MSRNSCSELRISLEICCGEIIRAFTKHAQHALDDERDRGGRREGGMLYRGRFYVSYPRIIEIREARPSVHGNYWPGIVASLSYIASCIGRQGKAGRDDGMGWKKSKSRI